MSNAQNDDDDGDDDEDRAFWRHNGFGGETPKGDLGIVGDLGISTRRTAVPRTCVVQAMPVHLALSCFVPFRSL